MENFKKAWINELIDNIEKTDNPGPLQANGISCSYKSGMIDQIRKSLNDYPYVYEDLRGLADYMLAYVFNEHSVEYQDDFIKLTYGFDSCVCPAMKEIATNNPFACNCSIGFIKNCVKEISGKELGIKLVDSFIKNDKPCSFMISSE